MTTSVTYVLRPVIPASFPPITADVTPSAGRTNITTATSRSCAIAAQVTDGYNGLTYIADVRLLQNTSLWPRDLLTAFDARQHPLMTSEQEERW